MPTSSIPSGSGSPASLTPAAARAVKRESITRERALSQAFSQERPVVGWLARIRESLVQMAGHHGFELVGYHDHSHSLETRCLRSRLWQLRPMDKPDSAPLLLGLVLTTSYSGGIFLRLELGLNQAIEGAVLSETEKILGVEHLLRIEVPQTWQTPRQAASEFRKALKTYAGREDFLAERPRTWLRPAVSRLLQTTHT